VKQNLAKHLRQSMTDAEQLLWQRLRYRQLQDCKFRRQAPIGDFVVDFVCHERKLIIELDGGGHTRRREQDASRTKWFESQGFAVLRFWNFEVTEDLECVLEGIWNALNSARTKGTRLRVKTIRSKSERVRVEAKTPKQKPKDHHN